MTNSAGGLEASPGTVGAAERFMSFVSGLGLMSLARTDQGLRRTAFGLTGAALLARGATGYCPVKAAIADGRSRRSPAGRSWPAEPSSGRGDAARIRTFEALFQSELQELYSNDQQFARLLERAGGAVSSPKLAQKLRDHAGQVEAQAREVEVFLEAFGASPDAHPDQAMQALAAETMKMSRIDGSPELRDAAIVGSIQRLIHYRVGALGTIAAYAETLGRTEEARMLAERDRAEKQTAAELSAMAKVELNPAAAESLAW